MEVYQPDNESDAPLESPPEGFVHVEGPYRDWHSRVGQNPSAFERVLARHPDAVLVRSDRSPSWQDAYASPSVEHEVSSKSIVSRLLGKSAIK